MLVAGGASVIRDGASGHDGVTIVETGDSLFEVDLLLILIVLPVAGCKVALLFIRHTPNKHMKMMPATAARLIMIGNFIFSKNGVVIDGGISVFRLLLTNFFFLEMLLQYFHPLLQHMYVLRLIRVEFY